MSSQIVFPFSDVPETRTTIINPESPSIRYATPAAVPARAQPTPALPAGFFHSVARRYSGPAFSSDGFTLTEMVVVVSIILVLAALLMPALQKSVDSSRQVQCVSNLRQLSESIRLYASDSGNRIPSSTTWTTCVAPYLGLSATASNLTTLSVFRCPAGWTAGARTAAASNQATYNYNCHPNPFYETPANSPTGTNTYYFSSPPLSLFNHPAQTIILSCWWFFLWGGNWTTPPGDTHSNGRPVAYLDGHVVFQTGPTYYQYGAPPMSALTQF
jgi:prepilin-type N-terminal cleavage/methylation domain-containing protein/prepilin-type processing-associated H-X9-DG protein